MLHIGLDVHQRTSTYCILDANGKQIRTETIRGHWDRVLEVLRRLDEPFEVCFEASCGYGALHDRLRCFARRVVVAHPGQLRLIFRARRKNDRVDAEKLAKLLFLDEVPTAHVPGQPVRAWRSLIEYRRRLVDKRTRCKNAIRALLRGQGVAIPRGLWTRKGVGWLTELALPAAAGVQRDLLLDELAMFTGQIKRITAALDRIGQRNPGVHLLRTIPGVGARTAETVVAYIDNPDRFTHSGQIGSYFGLVPTQDASAGQNRLGRISRDGPATARKYLTEAAWQAKRRSPTAAAYFERLTHGQPDRRRKALVATAHWLVRCMWSMLRTGEVWRETA
jgi:transposase